MDFHLKKCLVADTVLKAEQVRKQLHYPHLLSYVLLDLGLLDEEIIRLGEEKVITSCLAGGELAAINGYALYKRKREWLGGRCAAKYAAAGLVAEAASGKNFRSWPDYIIAPDENGKPLLVADKEDSTMSLPDISISHSGSMAAAMAVYKGFCGIDIQKITNRVLKVSERFCTDEEKLLLDKSFPAIPDKEAVSLTKLWAAKETLRKVCPLSSLPGFLEMQLVEIEPLDNETDFAVFGFNLNKCARTEHGLNRVVVSVTGDYALAFTARDDSVG